MAKFDIVVPAYNAERYLAAALEGVLAQTCEDWRILLVNDGSTDHTAEIAASYQARIGEKMLVISQPNAGLPAARNAALHVATAEYIAILDADDIWFPCRLAESLKSLEQRPQAGLSYGVVTRIDENDHPFSTSSLHPQHAEGNVAPYIYMRTIDLPCPTITFRRRCLEEVGFFDETMRATEDRDMWLRIALRHEIVAIPRILAYYRTSLQSMSGDMNRMSAAQLRFIRKHYGGPGCGRVQRAIATSRVYKQRAEGWKFRHRPWLALGNALRAFALWPFSQDNIRTAASLLLTCARLK
jgi:glycosyltransferase involved in cell wall biosynthesis